MHNNVIYVVISTRLLKGQHLTMNSNEYMN